MLEHLQETSIINSIKDALDASPTKSLYRIPKTNREHNKGFIFVVNSIKDAWGSLYVRIDARIIISFRQAKKLVADKYCEFDPWAEWHLQVAQPTSDNARFSTGPHRHEYRDECGSS